MLIGVTDESPEIVEAWLAKKKTKPSYPIAIMRGGKLESALGVTGFPSVGIIDPKGILISAGFDAEKDLGKALATAKKGSIWPAKLQKSIAALRAGDLAKAYAEAKKAAGDVDADDKPAQEKIASFLESTAADALGAARALSKEGRIAAAVEAATPIAKAEPPFPATEDAKKLVAELEATPNYKLEVQGGAAFAAADALEAEEKYLDAVEGYRAVIKKAAGTKIAELAEKRAKGLVEKGMPGYSPSCEKCHGAKKACEKHAKPVKI